MPPYLGFKPIGAQPTPGTTVDLLAGRDLLSAADPRKPPDGIRYGPFETGLTGLSLLQTGEFRRISDGAQADIDGNVVGDAAFDASRVAVHLVDGEVNGTPFGVIAAALIGDCATPVAPPPPVVDCSAAVAADRAKAHPVVDADGTIKVTWDA